MHHSSINKTITNLAPSTFHRRVSSNIAVRVKPDTLTPEGYSHNSKGIIKTLTLVKGVYTVRITPLLGVNSPITSLTALHRFTGGS